MRDKRLTHYFSSAVLLALSLPAGCAGDPHFDPPASCDFTRVLSTTCDWDFTFKGDPLTCVGFAANPTAEECLAICGRGSQGDAPTSCVASPPYGVLGVPRLTCLVSNMTDCGPTPLNGGRRPEYFASLGFGDPAPGREVGTHFARVACMEAGSVEAFRALRAELAAHGAPKRLLRAASRAMRDEIRHVRQTAALARRFGEEPIAPIPCPARPTRSLEAIARENALEGCVRETFSALECAWQAAKSEDPVVRATMARIAKDEMRHLELSWAVHRWAMSRIDRAGREAIRAAQRREIAALAREVDVDPANEVVRVVGLPRAFQARALIAAIDAAC
jgi:hypothetical protein